MPTQLGSKAIGSIVKVRIGGVEKEFIVVQHGRPLVNGIASANYSASLDNATIIMARDTEAPRQWGNYNWQVQNNNYYPGSLIDTYLNNEYFNSIDALVRAEIVQVTIPVRLTGQTSGTTGHTTRIFLPSIRECGIRNADYSSQFESWGVQSRSIYVEALSGDLKFDYFDFGEAAGALAKRAVATSGEYWLRSTIYRITTSSTWPGGDFAWGQDALHFDNAGNMYRYPFITTLNQDANIIQSRRVRPTFALPKTILVNDSNLITMNTAPTVPPSLTVPTPINGGTTITISWGASTDAEGNLAGYILQRSTDGGSNWAQIFQGPALSTTNNVAFGTVSVMFRVLAYDTEGLQSGWRTGSNITVINNRPPTTPGTIQVPLNVIGGGFIVVTWGASTDPDNNLSGYRLQRSVNGAAFVQIFEGTALNFTDSITMGWQTVQYRVKAFDSYNAESDFSTSPVRTVDNNRPPTITSDYSGDLGLKSDGFTWTYTVNDPDGDTVTVIESINGVQKRTYTAVLGQLNTFDVTGMTFMTLLNGANAMNVMAADNRGKSAEYNVTFTKGVYALSIQLAQPMANLSRSMAAPVNLNQISKMVMNIVRSIPADAPFTVLASNNANDPTPVWEDVTLVVKSGYNYVFNNTTAVNGFAFSFRITASRGPSNTGGFVATIGGAFE